MKIPDSKLLAAAAMTMLAAAIAVDTSIAPEGWVLDRATGKPIEGAYVIAEWRGVVSLIVEGRSRCYAAAATVTNSQGHWTLRDFSWNFEPWIFDRRQSISFYYPGFQRVYTDEKDGKVVFMESRKGAKPEQYKEVRKNTILADYCEGTTRAKAFLAVRKVRAMELRALATTGEEIGNATSELRMLEEFERGGGPQ
jgi:hypothetical protein